MVEIERAIVLVAGGGRRLGALTKDRPKCLVKVGGRSILERALRSLADSGVSETILVIGYRGDQVRNRIGRKYAGMEIRYVENSIYSETNTAYSLWLAGGYLDRACWLLEGDILFNTQVLQRMRQSAGAGGSVWAAVPVGPGKDEGILLRRDENGTVADVERVKDPGKRRPVLGYKCAGIQLLTSDLAREFAVRLDAVIAEGKRRYFADLVLGQVIGEGAMALCSLDDLQWAEVDTVGDLTKARNLFNGKRPASTR